ncbi:MAG TPA: DUF2252 family protein [Rhodocyclaceae bacterium]|nr:DUF2252 family protein [Rhodocyclaceae bacterium]
MATAAARPQDRATRLKVRRARKMARSAHAYVRGSTARFYAWLAASDGDALPDGPPVWICGDCHLGNLGPVADSDGRTGVEIRDLDQAVIGNPAHDLVRLGLSLACACRSADLPGVMSLRVVDMLLDGYARAFAQRPRPPSPPDSVKAVIRRAVKRTWKQLMRDYLDHARPRIPLGARFWPLTRREQGAIAQCLDETRLPELARQLGIARDTEAVRVADAAYWVKGCSSLGRPRYVVLLQVDGAAEARLAMVDIKDAPPAAAPRTGSVSMPRDNAERVVEAARALAPALGGRMVAMRLLDRPMVARELSPQDLKIEPDQLAPADMAALAHYLGRIVGDAHARQMSAPQRRHWHATLRRSHSRVVDAPSWLWRAIVDALADHERGYLEHCRRHVAALVA